ncbi:MAG TPA: T9SS type A sorting domain-containing protein [Flavipsychrobacter sp.]|nr:T9SS type A sorting domain-containing protein [Flavipsychrobacter sp.]
MKHKIILLALAAAAGSAEAQTLNNNGASIHVKTGGGLYVRGSLTNSATGYIQNNGTGVTGATGTVINNNRIVGTGNLVLNGSTAQVMSGVGIVTNLTLNNSAGASVTSGTGNQVNVVTSLTLTNGTLTGNANLVLKSNDTNTARVAPINTAVANVSGDVVVERFVGVTPQLAGRRAWRLMTAPLKGNNGQISLNWQNDFDGNSGSITPGVGTNISNLTGNNGADFASPDYSLKYYDVAAQAMTGVANINNARLFQNVASAANEPYFIFIRGDKTVLGTWPPAPQTTTTLKALGQLQTGSQTFTSPALTTGQFWVVGNPFASPVNFDSVTRSANLPRRFYAWDPNLNTIGGYVTVDDVGNTGTYTITPSGSAQTQMIQSGQAIFLSASSNGVATLTFDETDKSTTVVNNIFKTTSSDEKLIGTLYGVDANNNVSLLDGFTQIGNAQFADAVDNLDAIKFSNVNENIGIASNGNVLAIERKNTIGVNTGSTQLQFSNTRLMNYRLRVETENYNAAQHLYLKDAYLNSYTPLAVNSNTDYDFTVTNDNGSWDPNRFSILATGSNPLSVDDAVKEESSLVIYPNPVQNGQLNLSFRNMEAGGYQATIINAQGQVVQQLEITHANGKNVHSVKLNSGLASGIYQLHLVKDGLSYQQAFIVQP